MSMLQASRLPTLVNMGRLVVTRVFNAHSLPQPPSTAHVGSDGLDMVPLAISSAGGFEIETKGGTTEPTVSTKTGTPGPVLPRSLHYLIVNNVPVKPERLLHDLQWDRLLKSEGALDEEHRAAAKTEMEKLSALHRQGMKIDPQTALEIFRRFATWTDLMNLGELLSNQPHKAETERYEGSMDLYVKDVDLLERMRDKVKSCIERGNYEQAQKLADRAVQKSGHLCALLNTLRRRLSEAEDRSVTLLHERIRTAGGFVLIALGASYMGYSVQLPGLPTDIVAATADAATLGTVVCLLATTAQWIRTPDFGAHLDRIQQLQFQREVTRNQIDSLACEALMEASEPTMSVPSTPAPVATEASSVLTNEPSVIEEDDFEHVAVM
mmetsp:Transcript_20714/g.29157  ORF Transcript_20714/g.29157 Transcript_20714/m.29157 type:complete len:381 (-) Transcript_20714:123-1265(-)